MKKEVEGKKKEAKGIFGDYPELDMFYVGIIGNVLLLICYLIMMLLDLPLSVPLYSSY